MVESKSWLLSNVEQFGINLSGIIDASNFLLSLSPVSNISRHGTPIVYIKELVSLDPLQISFASMLPDCGVIYYRNLFGLGNDYVTQIIRQDKGMIVNTASISDIHDVQRGGFITERNTKSFVGIDLSSGHIINHNLNPSVLRGLLKDTKYVVSRTALLMQGRGTDLSNRFNF